MHMAMKSAFETADTAASGVAIVVQAPAPSTQHKPDAFLSAKEIKNKTV